MTLIEVSGEAWAQALLNHLWQSTVVVGIAWLLSLALRKNHARTRYWVWMVASVKFLIPFSLFITAGKWLRSALMTPIIAKPSFVGVMEQVVQPFPQTQLFDTTSPAVTMAHPANMVPFVVLAIWAYGFLVVAARIARGLRKVYAARQGAQPLQLDADVPVFISTSQIEPGIFGIFKPVLLLPEGILDRLTEEQLQAIVAHEMCHVRRRDNLTFAAHMVAEVFFWFHPGVWWIGARLIEEREIACDEAVVQAGGDPQIYAEGILNVCKFYVESPLRCAAGVTGSDLKKRIGQIVGRHSAQKVNLVRKLLLGGTTLMAVTLPIVLGLAQKMETPSDWEKAAGRKQQFEVASVRENKSGGRSSSNFALDSGNAYVTISKADQLTPAGSLFSAQDQPLLRYIIFAYKLSGTQELALRFDYYKGLELHVPDLARNGHYDIEARAPVTATKDQMRLMMQNLLADRFKLAVHWETRPAPVFALMEDKPGILGPQLARHTANDDCEKTKLPDTAAPTTPTAQPAITLSALPIPCDMTAHLPVSAPENRRFGGRDAPMELLANSLPTQTGMAVIPRPVIDETGLSGGYDFMLEWTPEDTSEISNGETGGTFREALKQQLGLKLVPTTGPVPVLVIDHVELPSPN